MLIEIQTSDGPRKVRVCDYCRSACIPSGRFCSGRCARSFDEMRRQESLTRPERCEARGEGDHLSRRYVVCR
jgi:hypothetical protein